MSRNILQPESLPTADMAVKLFTSWRDAPSAILHGIRPVDLFKGYDVDRTWFVGSTAWFPAIMGEPAPDDADIDLVFSTEDIAMDFFDNTSKILIERRPDAKPSVTENIYGGRKFSWNLSSKNVLDVWWLPKGHSIAEHVLTYPKDHEHVAILAGAHPGEVNALTRIVRYPEYISQRGSWNYANHKREYERTLGKKVSYDFGS